MQNLGMAFHLITKEFAVARLLETEDLLSNDSIDARSVAIYLIELRAAVEMDRRRRNKPTFEIRTAAMVLNYFIAFKQYLLSVYQCIGVYFYVIVNDLSECMSPFNSTC